MNVDAQLTAIRELSDTSTGPGDTVRMRALINAFRDLDAHLSAGGTPPEEWREGPDAPHLDDDDQPIAASLTDSIVNDAIGYAQGELSLADLTSRTRNLLETNR